MPTVKLDMSDPGTKAVVDGWEDSTEYVIKTGTGPTRAIAEVIEPETEQPDETEAVPTNPGPTAVKDAMTAKSAAAVPAGKY